MSQSAIRIIKTPDVERVIRYLRSRFNLLSEPEITKLALSELYKKELEESMEHEQAIREAFYHAIAEGSKIGDKYLAERGINRDNMSEQELYEAVFNSPKIHEENNR